MKRESSRFDGGGDSRPRQTGHSVKPHNRVPQQTHSSQSARMASLQRRGRGIASRSLASSGRPNVSVVIPCYNCAETIGETLASVFAQSYRNFEVVLVNDGSHDTFALESAIKPWRDKITYLVTENRGVAAARNHGIRAARGQLIALLDSDDLWEPNYLEVQVAKLESEPDADIVYPNAFTFGDGMPAVSLLQSIGEVTLRSLLEGTCVVFVSVLARREALERVGLFDERLRRCEDFDLWLRCVIAGSRIIYHHQVLARYRCARSGRLSSSETAMFSSLLVVLLKLRQTIPHSSPEKSLLNDAIRRTKYRILFSEGKAAFRSGDIPLAIDRIEEAYRRSPSPRLGLIVVTLRTMPHRFVRLAYDWQLNARREASRIRSRINEAFVRRDPLAA